jgi:hypothetical protein
LKAVTRLLTVPSLFVKYEIPSAAQTDVCLEFFSPPSLACAPQFYFFRKHFSNTKFSQRRHEGGKNYDTFFNIRKFDDLRASKCIRL